MNFLLRILYSTNIRVIRKVLGFYCALIDTIATGTQAQTDTAAANSPVNLSLQWADTWTYQKASQKGNALCRASAAVMFSSLMVVPYPYGPKVGFTVRTYLPPVWDVRRIYLGFTYSRLLYLRKYIVIRQRILRWPWIFMKSGDERESDCTIRPYTKFQYLQVHAI
jgi:hypothetical protein